MKKKAKTGPPNPKAQNGNKKKTNKKPGKRQRMVMKLESDKTFPIMLEGKIKRLRLCGRREVIQADACGRQDRQRRSGRA